MLQKVMTIAEFQKAALKYHKQYGRSFLKDHTVTCYAWPLLDKRFGNQVITHKDFYAGIPDISE